jgi:hypothetical protein
MATFDVNVNVGSGSEDEGLVPTSDGAGGIDWKKAVDTDGNPEGISPISSAGGVSPIELRRYRDSNTIDAQADTGAVSFNLKFSAPDRYWYSDNANDPVEGRITQAGRDLLDDATTADQRNTLGLGALATKSTVATGDIDNNAVTFVKMQDISSAHLIGRHSTGSGHPQSIGIDGSLELQGGNLRRAALTGDVTASAGNNATTIANDAVTNAKLANMAQATIKGRQAGAGTGDPEDLTASQARTAMGLGTAAVVNTGTGSGDVPTTSQADARYLTPFAYSLLAAWTVGTQATTAVTMTDVTNTELTVPGAGMYEFEYRVTYNANAVGTGSGFTARNTVGGTADYSAIETGVDAGSGDRSTFRGGFALDVVSATSRVTTGNQAIVRGRVIFNAASAIRLQFRTETVTSTTITVTDVIGFIRRVS